MTLEKYFLLPIFFHMLMVFIIAVMMGRARFMAVRSGQAKREEVAINDAAWPTRILLIAKNFNNQFQVPMMWYALSIIAIAVQKVDVLLVILSWVFLATRLLHSYIHISSNRLPDRFYAYLIGFVVFGFMWLRIFFNYFGS